MDKILDYIKIAFNQRVSIQEKRPGIYQLYLPIFHEDGDMIDIFIVPKGGNTYQLCDFGLTLMRLSYYYEIDTPNKEAILQRILVENGMIEEDGNLIFQTKVETIFTDIMMVCQVYAKIGSMKYFKREVVESLFYEILDDYIVKELIDFKPQKKVSPIPSREDLEVDYQFSPNGHPVYLFGVKDSARARLATISCLEFQKAKINFRSIIVHEDFEKLSKKDRKLLTNTCDKQFTSLDEFKEMGRGFLERERSI